MRKWNEFGDQVNRLVYALAGRKFQADIECANRFIAERIFYSEVSVRMMRQGRFRPREEKALETLVEIGQSEAELGRDWAYRLLHSAQHSTPELVLQRIYPQEVAEKTTTPHSIALSSFQIIVSRITGGVLGSFLALLLWTYLINPVYPAPHELSFFREAIWGLLIGVGLAGGIVGSDIWLNNPILGATRNEIGAFIRDNRFPKPPKISFFLARYLALPASGGLGALLWNGIGTKFFDRSIENPVASTGLETFSFGATYGIAFALGLVLAGKCGPEIQSRAKLWQWLLLFGFACGSAAFAGFLLAVMQPAFANQKDVDLFVGMMLRFGLIVLVSVVFP
jgi:hypothetical protein